MYSNILLDRTRLLIFTTTKMKIFIFVDDQLQWLFTTKIMGVNRRFLLFKVLHGFPL